MGSPARMTRQLVVAACLVASLGVPTVAFADPPDHAPAHGRSDRDDAATRTSTVAGAAGADGTGTGDGRGNAEGGGQGRGNAEGRGQGRGNAEGRGRGRDGAPGQVKKDPAPAREGTSTPADPRPEPDVASPPPSADGPVSRTEPTPAAPVTAPAPSAPGASDVVDEPSRPSTVTPVAIPGSRAGPVPGGGAAPVPEPSVAGGPPGRQVWRPDLGGPFGDLLEGVDRGVHELDRLVPGSLGGEPAPLSSLVPLLLAVLGAFLALQRGIGTGLGHVPMVAAAAPREPVRRD